MSSNDSKKMAAVWNKSRPWLTPGLPKWQAANLLGEVLYPKIHALWSAEKDTLPKCVTAGKITGMMVELPIEEGDPLATDDAALKAMYEKAKQVIIDYDTNTNRQN